MPSSVFVQWPSTHVPRQQPTWSPSLLTSEMSALESIHEDVMPTLPQGLRLRSLTERRTALKICPLRIRQSTRHESAMKATLVREGGDLGWRVVRAEEVPEASPRSEGRRMAGRSQLLARNVGST